jgi:hypothetical protein
MNEVAVQPEAHPETREARSLARELAGAYRDRVNRHKHELGLSTQEAVAKAEEPCSLSRTWRIQDGAPEELTWADLEDLVGQTGERALDRWEEVKQAALEALQSGHWAAAVLEGYDSRPWRRAQFLAIRAELTEGWQPRNGVERQLIDQMAQAQVAMFWWQERLFVRAAGAADEAGEPAAAMMDRFHRMFQRTLRMLCTLRKVPMAVIVQNAGQVNVGGQQVNLNGAGC